MSAEADTAPPFEAMVKENGRCPSRTGSQVQLVGSDCGSASFHLQAQRIFMLGVVAATGKDLQVLYIDCITGNEDSACRHPPHWSLPAAGRTSWTRAGGRETEVQ